MPTRSMTLHTYGFFFYFLLFFSLVFFSPVVFLVLYYWLRYVCIYWEVVCLAAMSAVTDFFFFYFPLCVRFFPAFLLFMHRTENKAPDQTRERIKKHTHSRCVCSSSLLSVVAVMNVRVLHWKVEWEKFTCYSHIALNVALNFARIYVLLVAVHTLWLVFFFSTLCRHAFLCLLFFLARFFLYSLSVCLSHNNLYIK